MAIYRYQHGDRPLEGYTIQHGLGRGGFGEVYYAMSDSGREVALKSVQNYEDIELRGIKHCMNLKSPQLVSIFDIRHNDEGLPFVIMEFVDGPSLRDILDSHPEGLGPAKAAFFLREIAKGLSYLHDCGVVHRDLKPHNVFYESGVVKIGDYSLSKAISTSHRTGHTVTVGTVHYMAPEISMGRYDHTVDIYALGVLFYEMLTGHPPFVGHSMGEVLMKHVAGDVDVSGIDEPYARVIKKALAKEPEQRYQTAQEMIDDLFGHEELQNSVAALGPESLTFVAEQAIKAVKATTPDSDAPEPHETAAYYRSSPATSKSPQPGSSWAAFKGRKAFVLLILLPLFILFFPRALFRNPAPVVVFGAVAVGLYLLTRSNPKFHQRALHGEAPRQPRSHQQAPPVVAEAVRPRGEEKDGGRESPGIAPAVARDVSQHVQATAAAPYSEMELETSSRYDRLLALILGAIFFLGVPIAGLQRFYVGRVKTGLLWLLTFGLFGIGQIVDMIMIALGQFRDSDGKRVLDFTKKRVHTLKQPVNQYSAIVRDKWTDSRVGFKLGNLVFNLLGGILLLGSLVVGAVVSIGIPEAIASGAFGKEIAFEIADGTQVHDWDKIAAAVMGVATIIAGTLAATCLLFARRESNWGHLFRIPVAATAFVGSVISLGATTSFGHRWHYVAEKVNDRLVGGAFEMLFGNQFWPPFVFACLLFIVGVFIMAWPARAKPTRTAPTPAAKHAREGHTV